MRRLISIAQPTTAPIDRTAEDRARREIVEAITELQSLPMAGARVIQNVSLANATATPVPHGLGRVPVFVGISAVRGPSTSGRIEEVRSTSGTNDRKKFVTLTANGYGATVVVDLLVM